MKYDKIVSIILGVCALLLVGETIIRPESKNGFDYLTVYGKITLLVFYVTMAIVAGRFIYLAFKELISWFRD